MQDFLDFSCLLGQKNQAISQALLHKSRRWGESSPLRGAHRKHRFSKSYSVKLETVELDC